MFSIIVSNLWEFWNHSKLSWWLDCMVVSQCLWLCWRQRHLTIYIEELGTSGLWMLFSVNLITLVLFPILVSSVLGIWKSGMFQGLNCWYLQKALMIKNIETVQMSLFLDSSGPWCLLLYLAPCGFYKPTYGNGTVYKNYLLLFHRKKCFLALSGDKRDLRRDQDNWNENKAVYAVDLNKVNSEGLKLLE